MKLWHLLYAALLPCSLHACTSVPERGASADPQASAQVDTFDHTELPRVPDPDYLCGQRSARPGVVLDVGHGWEDARLAGQSGSRVLSIGTSRWILWNTETRQQVMTGALPTSRGARGEPLGALVNDVALVAAPSGAMQLRRAHDGTVLTASLEDTRDWTTAGLSRDASYVWGASQSVLTILSREGRVIAQRKGIYSSGRVSAEPAVVRLADADRIISIAVPGGEVRTSGALYQGAFERWFSDGSHFLTREGSTLRVYTADSVLAQTLNPDLPGATRAGGVGGYVWTRAHDAVRVYRVGDGSEARTFALSEWSGLLKDEDIVSAGSSVAFLLRASLMRLDLGSEQPFIEEHQFPADWVTDFVSDESGNWTAMDNGVLYTSAHLREAGGPLPMGCGTVQHIAASPSGTVAVGTSDGKVRVFALDASGSRALLTLPFSSSHIAISDDGQRVLLDANRPYRLRQSFDRSLYLIDLAKDEVLHAFPHRSDDQASLSAFGLSRSGSEVARALCTQGGRCSAHLADTNGGPLHAEVMLTGSNAGNILFSPSEAVFGVAPSSVRLGGVTTFIENGRVTQSLPLGIQGWFDDSRLLVIRHDDATDADHAQIVSVAGELLSDASLPAAAGDLSVVDSDHVLSRIPVGVHRVSDGALTWGIGASTYNAEVSGDYVVWAREDEVVADRWR